MPERPITGRPHVPRAIYMELVPACKRGDTFMPVSCCRCVFPSEDLLAPCPEFRPDGRDCVAVQQLARLWKHGRLLRLNMLSIEMPEQARF